MRLLPTRLQVHGRRAHLRARLHGDDPASFDVDLLIGVPLELLPAVDRTANPFLALSALLATSLGEDLAVEAPASPQLVRGAQHSAAIYAGWVGGRGAAVTAAEQRPAEPSGEERGLLFSRGVDSWHSLDVWEQASTPPDRLITIEGIDLGDPAAAAGAHATSAEVAARVGYAHLALETGNRGAFDAVADWRLLHGAAFTGVVLAVGSLFSEVGIAAAVANRPHLSDGAHVDVVAGYGTEATRFTVIGSTTTRPEKIRIVADDGRGLPDLKVCWQPDQVGNCGRCVKCLITMTNLAAAGALDRAPFPPTLTVDSVLSVPMVYQPYVEDTVERLPDELADIRRAWRTRMAEHLGEPVLRIASHVPIDGIDLVLEAELAAAAVGRQVGPPAEEGTPLGWGEGALSMRAPARWRHRLTAAVDEGLRPTTWTYLGDGGQLAAEAVVAMEAAWGTGKVVAATHPVGGPRPLDLDRSAHAALLRTTTVRAWASEEPVVDGVRTLETVLAGAMPLQVAPDGLAQVLRSRMPEGTGAIVAAPGRLPSLDDLRAATVALRAELVRGTFERAVRTWFTDEDGAR
ncbi:hypothetical protein [Actinomarinicola tropica]|uniref:Uncharacterized protein n=1 Tax=Actinomarinicola tropica TaxID=2789776 RepID=A0A5Q2RMP8_9ACTN|nr:hypothetical protein [Actinomarinicola tropica]QGG95841.1 hypothetical protein GH723_12440 [Actinomarinicola tropica]